MFSVYLTAVSILLAWFLLGTLFVGIGALSFRLFRLSLQGIDDLFRAFWVGWAWTVCFLVVWHFWAPVDCLTAVPLILTGCLGVCLSARPFLASLGQRARTSRGLILWLAALLLLATLAAQAPLRLYDAGLYHLSAVRWANSFPAVPGLGNLHGRLAFNHTFFLYEALLNVGPLSGKSHHLAVGLLWVVLLGQLSVSAARILRNRSSPADRPEDYFRALLLIPTLIAVSATGFSTTNTDAPVFVLQVVTSAELLSWLRGEEAGRRQSLFQLFLVVLLAATGITVKLSFAVFGAAVIAVALAVEVVRHRARPWHTVGACAATGGVVLVVLVPWLARGVVLSGYPLYPSTAVPISVEWRVPEPAAREEQRVISEWARSSAGLKASVRTEGDAFIPPLAAGLLLLGAALWRGWGAGVVWLLLLPCWLGIIGWFLLAPWPRFAGALFEIACAGALILILPSLRPPSRQALVALVCALLIFFNGPQLSNWARTPAAVVRGRWLGHEEIPRVSLRLYTTSSGLQVYVPEEGDQVWDAPLPATPHPDERLRLRRPPDLSGGFRME